MNKQLYTNTGVLTWLVIRQDRIRLTIWLAAFIVANLLVANAFSTLYPAQAERQAMAETMMNPAITAMVGPAYGLDNYTVGVMLAHEMLLLTAVVVGVMNILLVARHTRAEEEDGRVELIRALPTGRLSNVASTLFVFVGTNVLLALLVAGSLVMLGIESIDVAGSMLYGASLGVTGIFFAGLTAVFAQLSESGRGTVGLGMAVLLIAYMVRAIGDVSSETLSMFSPFGWIVRTETFVNNYWWPVFATLGISLILMGTAFYLNGIRDMEAGFLPAKAGKKQASRMLLSPIGLAVRLQRTGIISWAIAMFVLGASYGSVLGDLESFFAENEMMQQLLNPASGVSLTEQFMTMLMAVLAMISTIPAMMFLLKLKGEEGKGRAAHLLVRSVSRVRLLGSFLALALAGGWVMLSLAALGLGVVGNAVMEEGIALGTFYQSAMVYLPAMWVMLGLAVLLLGWAPRATVVSWLYLVYSFIVVYMGGLFQFNEWVVNLSPFGHVPELPVEEVSWMSLLGLTGVAMLLLVAGVVGYRKRDIQGG
ncbi:ABC-2 type transport system permease protein [Thalassobacillus cyri]|uniref:ABC-2 type transport system permease protein n=1 Tax=Thalassobacillus cyri TaxID=571932 RepID=A0A1H4FNJ0_9BACI|nr:ABC transporter permease [Thalassobacillus cyri]SEA98855.1 ABC-2 type transport system permease protein [Thalassobacillus cyri]